MRPGEATWSIEYELNKGDIELKGGLANQSCPAHPSSYLNQEGDANNWETEDGVKQEVHLRCATHDLENAKWLVEQGRDGHISKEKVGAYLCQEEEDSRLSRLDDNAEVHSCLLAILDDDVQQEVAAWNPEATEKIAHKMGLGFIQGLIKQKIDGHWKGNGLGRVIWKKNKEGSMILPLLDFETQKEVASWNLKETNRSAHMASLDFIKWLIAQAEQGEGKKESVGSIIWRENKKKRKGRKEQGQVIFTLLDFETQKQVALWSLEDTNRNAHLISRDFVKWLVQMALEDRWPQEAVGSIVCKVDKNNQVILATLDFETQKQVAAFNQKETNQVAHLMSPDFQSWLIHQVSEGRWDRDEFVRTVCIKSASKRPTLPLFAEDIQKQIVVLDRTRTCQIIPWLGINLQEWLYQEAVEGRWDQGMVFKFLEWEEREGTECVTLKIHSGRNHVKSES